MRELPPCDHDECGPVSCKKKKPPLDPKGDEGKKKPQLQLIPPALNVELAKALLYGATLAGPDGTGYGPWNWRENKVEMMTYIGAIRRHLDDLLDREDIDPLSNAHHCGHIAANCAIILDALKFGSLVDNRPKIPKKK